MLRRIVESVWLVKWEDEKMSVDRESYSISETEWNRLFSNEISGWHIELWTSWEHRQSTSSLSSILEWTSSDPSKRIDDWRRKSSSAGRWTDQHRLGERNQSIDLRTMVSGIRVLSIRTFGLGSAGRRSLFSVDAGPSSLNPTNDSFTALFCWSMASIEQRWDRPSFSKRSDLDHWFSSTSVDRLLLVHVRSVEPRTTNENARRVS